MSKVVLAARNRQETGSAAAGRLRRSGRIPGVLYGRSGTSVSLDIDATEFSKGTKGISESTVITVDLDGSPHDVLVKDMQRNILDGKILHIDFYEVAGDQLLRVKVSLVVQGNPVGVREGGILELPTHVVEVECLPAAMPARLFVDISALKVGDSIHVKDIPLGDGVRLISGGDRVVALVKFPKGVSAAADAPAEEEAKA